MAHGYWSDKIVPVIVGVFFGALCTFLLTWTIGYLEKEEPRLVYTLTPVTTLSFDQGPISFQQLRVANVGNAAEENVCIKVRAATGCIVDKVISGYQNPSSEEFNAEEAVWHCTFDSFIEGAVIYIYFRLREGAALNSGNIEVFGLHGFGQEVPGSRGGEET